MRVLRGLVFTSSLLLLTVASPDAAQQVPTYIPHKLAPSLRTQAETLLGKGDYAGAGPLLERWLEADPHDSGSWYNLACVYSKGGNKEKALDAFERSVDAGFADAGLPAKDKDLDAIRVEPRFISAVARITDQRKAKGPAGYIPRTAPMRSEGSYIVMLPPDYETSKRDYPLCLILQGSGSTELSHGMLSDKLGREGVIYAAIRAPYPSIPVIASSGQPGYTAWPPDEGPPSMEDTARIDYVNWILDVTQAVRKEFRVRSGKIFVYGHSQGGQFATLTALLHPELVGGYLAQAGSAVPGKWFTASRLGQMKKLGVSVWVIQGLSDETVPVSTSVQLADRLKNAGIPVTLHTVEGGHTINDGMVKLGKQWIEEVVRNSK